MTYILKLVISITIICFLIYLMFSRYYGGDGFTNFGGWSSWTEWSSCSRSCDGGASSMTRKCLFNKGCRYGKLTRYRICNMQPCNDAKNFRDVQCSEYDNKLYNGQFHKWSVAPYNPLRPCALSCSSNRTSVVPVGCDLQLDSTKKIDECGVCGGDGSSCHQSSYHWYETGLSECSVSCGGGMQISQPVCRNRITGTQVDDWYCDASSRPRPIVHECNTFPCLSVWQTESWSECSSSCNGGTQWRAVYCFEGRENGTDFRVDNKECNSERPISERACNLVPCPKWTAEPWSPCSVSCGSGYRTRSVYCKDADGLQNQSCDMTQKPAKRQRCVLTHICSPAQHRKLENEDRKASDNLPRPQQQNSASNKPRFVAGEWGECSSSNTCGWGFRQRQVRCKVYVEFSGEVILSDDDCSDSVKPLGKDKCFLRPCDDYISNTLDGSNMVGSDEDHKYRKPVGQGVRESITECIRTKDDAVVSPTNCDLSTKPDQLIQTCNNRPCPPRWNISDFTPCTKNCGGGKQFRTVHCIHEVTRGNVLSVSNKLCPQPPPRLERLCGVISCPIKWKTGQWSQCSKSCGGGVKTRTVKCQRTLAYGQVIDQPSSRCRRRKPRTVKSCKSRSCPSPTKSKSTSPRIFSNPKQVFVQKIFKKKETLKVGGKATVFKGVNLKLKCRVKGRFNRTKLIWIKDRDFIKYSKRISISRNGALRIKSMTYSDSGFYMCKAHSAQANMTIIVKPRPDTFVYNSIEDDNDKDDDIDVRKRRRQRNKKNRKSRRRKKQKSYDNSNYMKTPKNNHMEYSHEDNANDKRQKEKYAGSDSKQRRHHRPSVVHYEQQSLSSMELMRGSRNPPNANQKDKSHSVEEVNGFDTWEIQHGDPSRRDGVSDVRKNLDFDESHEMHGPRNIKSNPGSTNEDDVFASKVPPVSYAKVHTTTKSHKKSPSHWKTRMYATTPIGHRLLAIRECILALLANAHFSKITSIEENSHEELISQTKQQRDSEISEEDDETTQLRWEVGEWEKCSVECGGSGYQIRSSQCFVQLNKNISKSVDKMLCASDSGLTTPATIRQCGQEECPQWQTSNWSQCSRSRCVALNTAMMRRKLHCRLRNDTEVSRTRCNKKTKPKQKRECYNAKCKASWKVGRWSECPIRECRKGMEEEKKEEKIVERRRVLECIWYGTNKPAGSACNHLVRPSVTKPCTYSRNDCKSISLQNNILDNRERDCVDKTRYCIIAKSVDMCRMYYYKKNCCLSCSKFISLP
ncbi:Protein madd-4 [Nymphon striatum]|nr:Protein madd-4 [Nymphon striatum]